MRRERRKKGKENMQHNKLLVASKMMYKMAQKNAH